MDSPCAHAAAPVAALSSHPPSPWDEPRGPRRRSQFSAIARQLQLSSPLPSHRCNGGHGPRKNLRRSCHNSIVGGLQLDKFMRKLPATDCISATHGCDTKTHWQLLHQFSRGIAASPKQEVPASRIADCSKRKGNRKLQYPVESEKLPVPAKSEYGGNKF